MSKGRQKHQERLDEVRSFGRMLARRSKSKCELSGASGVALHIYEIPPAPAEPDPARCLMLSEDVIDQLNKPSRIVPDQWRGLGELIWSEIPAVQIMACRILTHIAKEENWAQDILDEAYLDEALVEQANESPLA